MFDEDQYESDQDEDFRMGYKSVVRTDPKALAPNEPNTNMALSMKQGEELMKLMKERGSISSLTQST